MLRKERIFLFLVLLLAIIRGSSYIFIKNIIDTQSPFEFLTSLYIVIIPLLDFIFFKNKIKKNVIALFFLILVGLLFISFKDFKNFEFSLNFGDILTILCALGFALNILLFSKIKKFNINVINITIIQMLTIGILAFIFQIIFEKKVINFSMNFSLIYLILICTMLNFTIQNISQKYVPAHIMGLILSLEAIFGTVFAIIFLNETISQNFIIGTFLIAIAVILIQYFENKRGD